MVWRGCIVIIFFLWKFNGVNTETCIFQSKLNNQLVEEDYNTNTHLCCREIGVISRIDSDGEKVDCCGNSSYQVKKKICCGQKIYRRTSEGLSCCGGRNLFSLRNLTTRCCDGILHTNIGSNTSCCGTSVYNPNKDFCCDDYATKNFNLTKRDSRDLECCRWMPYDTKTHFCFRKEVPLPFHFEMCKNDRIDIRKFICCDGIKRDKYLNGKEQKCCGTNAHGPDMRCCMTSLPYHIAPKNSYCCMDKYVTENQRCCLNKILNATSTEECCGVTLYDTTTEGCCNSNITFNKSTEKCCTGIGGIGLKTAKEKECCGSADYHPSTQVCCGNSFVIDKVNQSHDSCCVPRTTSKNKTAISYKKGTSFCNRNTGKIYSEPNCGSDKYTAKTDLCCNNVIYVNAKSLNMKCCYPGRKIFDPNAEVCCDGIVYSRKERPKCVGVIKGVEYSICRYGHWSKKEYLEALDAGKLDICRENAIRVSILSVNVTGVGSVVQTEFTVRPKKNLYDSSSAIPKIGKMSLSIPCTVEQDTKYKNALLITNISPFKKRLRLGDADILMPYTSTIAKAVKKRFSKCQMSVIKRIKKLISIGNKQ